MATWCLPVIRSCLRVRATRARRARAANIRMGVADASFDELPASALVSVWPSVIVCPPGEGFAHCSCLGVALPGAELAGQLRQRLAPVVEAGEFFHDDG